MTGSTSSASAASAPERTQLHKTLHWQSSFAVRAGQTAIPLAATLTVYATTVLVVGWH